MKFNVMHGGVELGIVSARDGEYPTEIVVTSVEEIIYPWRLPPLEGLIGRVFSNASQADGSYIYTEGRGCSEYSHLHLKEAKSK